MPPSERGPYVLSRPKARRRSGRGKAVDRCPLPSDFKVIHGCVACKGAAHEVFSLRGVAFEFAVVVVLVHDAEGEFGEHSDLRGVVMTGRRLMGL